MNEAVPRAQRGKASEYLCEFCGYPAYAWAYDHDDPEVKYDKATGMPFSLDLNHYIPLCGSCHKRLDLFMAGGRETIHGGPVKRSKAKVRRPDGVTRAAGEP